jgi:uncharacterized Ntn-hydrolase superfamily protein
MHAWTVRFGLGVLAVAALAGVVHAAPPQPSTFSIAAADAEAGEVGVAVASRFFAVGAVVPWARAGVGAVATQANANTTFGPRGLELLSLGLTPEETVKVLLRTDSGNNARQVGIVSAAGASATYSGPGCTPWAGGRKGPSYAVQGNILAGENVVVAMESAFLASKGKPLAERLYAALKAGDAAGGDSRGKRSAAILVCRAKAGFNGFTDRAVDIRVDDSPEPFVEIGRLLGLAMVNDAWNRGWTAFTEKRFPEALTWQERAAARAESQPAMLPEVLYDLAVIRLANGDKAGAQAAVKRAIRLNPKLATQARQDNDLAGLRGELP